LIDDFQNFSLEKCKKLILKYQETKDSEIFYSLLAHFDKYLIFLIYKYNKYVSFLRNEPIQDLYHISILGFLKGILSLKKTLPAEKLILRIGSYVVSELKQNYIYKIKENIPIFEEGIINNDISKIFYVKGYQEYNKQLAEISISIILSTSILEKEEKELIILKYINNYTYSEIAKKKNLSYNKTFRLIEGAIIKLQEGVKR
jgi:hypothetical protein